MMEENNKQQTSPADVLSTSGIKSQETIEVAYLYTTTDAQVGWSSSLSWKAVDLIDLKHCPVSGDSVAMICDGVAMSSTQNDNEKDSTSSTIVRFKYGKKTFQLSTAARTGSLTSKPNKGKSSTYSLFGSWFGMTNSSNPSSDSSSSSSSSTTTPKEILFAQDRIADALDLVSLKILHKGSLLLDSQAMDLSDDEKESLSRELLKISDQDWSHGNRKKKATLVVMGTRRDDRLEELPNDNANESGLQILKRSIVIPINLLYWPCKMAWYFVFSFLEPFLPPQRMLGTSDNRRGGDSGFRPHQD